MKKILMLVVFLLFIFNSVFAWEKPLNLEQVSNENATRFICSAQIMSSIYYQDLTQKIEADINDGTDDFSISINGDKLSLSTDDRALNGNFKLEPEFDIKRRGSVISGSLNSNTPGSEISFGRVESIILNTKSGLGSWVRNGLNIIDGRQIQDIQSYSITCKSVN